VEEKDWLMLKTLYEEKNITKAAELLYISQPAITYRLQQLEKEFGTKVVSRGKKGVEFTSQGECLVNYAEKMLLELQKTREMVQNMNNKVKGTLRLGSSNNFARYRLPLLLKQFVEFYPEVEINVKTGWSHELLNSLYKDVIHIGIIRGDHNWQEQTHLLFKEPLCVASNYRISLDDLPDLPRINYQTDLHLMQTIKHWWHKKFTRPPLITMEVDRIETCIELVKNGLGYAIIPSIGLNEQDSLFTEICSVDNNTIVRESWLLCRDASLELSVVKAFVDFAKGFFNNNPNL
jgi:DNA-binding transcriptional LysR family regulator